VLQFGRGVAADGAHVAGQNVGPMERVGFAHCARFPRSGLDAVEGGILELLERRRGGLGQRLPTADQGHGWKGEVDEGIGVAQVSGAPLQRPGQPAVVEAGNHQHALLGEDARLGAIGQDDSPAFQPGADAGAINDGRLRGHGGQRRPQRMGAALVAQFQRGGHAFQGDGINLAVAGRDERPRPLGVPATTDPSQPQVMFHEAIVVGFVAFAGMDDQNVFHVNDLS